MPLFAEYKLSIPKVWDSNWEKALTSATGIRRDLLATRKEAAALLQDIDEIHATPERLGWLNLWSKVFMALDAVLSAIESGSNLILQLIYKNTFELMLQVHSVLDPVFNLHKMPQMDFTKADVNNNDAEYAYRSTIERLRVYVAYCLWHDKAYYEELINPRSFKEVWEFTPNSWFVDDGNIGQRYSYFLDKWRTLLKQLSDKDLKYQTRKTLLQKIKRIDEWLLDPSLRRWAAAMNTARSRLKGGVPFFSIFDQSDRSIPQRLIKEGLRFGYSSYVMSSMMSHASSMDGFIRIDGGTAFLISDGENSEIEGIAGELLLRCRHLFVLLTIIHCRILSRPELRS